jgi:hypothetical protein
VLSEQGTDLSRAAIEAIALEGYRSRRLSTGQVRRLLGFATRIRVHEFLKEHGVYTIRQQISNKTERLRWHQKKSGRSIIRMPHDRRRRHFSD